MNIPDTPAPVDTDAVEPDSSGGEKATHRPRRLLRSPRVWIAAGITLVVLVGVGVGSFFLFSPKTNGMSGRTTTAEATLGTQTATVSLDGTLSPRKQADLNFQVSGEVTHVYVKAGDTVTKGQKLATIDDTSLQNAVDLASANLSSANANYSEVASSGTSAAKRAAAAQVDSAAASLASAKEDLKNATLRATFAGTIASVDIATGDQVSGSSSSGSGGGSSQGGSGSTTTSSSSSSAAIVLIATASWKLEGSVGASDLSALKAGQAAKITIDTATAEGTVASVGIVATSSSDGAATFPVVINLTGTHKDLYSGTTASAVITTGTYDNVLTIPTAAITTASGKTVVTKVNTDNSTTVTTVEVGRVFGTATEITSGLASGDKVQITFRPSSTSTSSNSSGGFGFGGGGGGGGLGGGLDGGPPAGGGGAPGGQGAGR
ncbi:MAG: biotin/lipoyl-binding protein [Propionibacteriales bacterium]|nr:biotin/lipoyl-binding protein [Propionibacteriales bacterium]